MFEVVKVHEHKTQLQRTQDLRNLLIPIFFDYVHLSMDGMSRGYLLRGVSLKSTKPHPDLFWAYRYLEVMDWIV